MIEIDMVYDDVTRLRFYEGMKPAIEAVLSDGGDLEKGKYPGIVCHGYEARLGKVHIVSSTERSTGITKIKVKEDNDIVLRVVDDGKGNVTVPLVRSGYWISKINEYATMLLKSDDDDWEDVDENDLKNS